MPIDQGAEPDEVRIAPRTNMYIAAVLNDDGGACPVRIRNLSGNGALIEAPALPPPGTAVELVRSVFRASGEVIWLAGSRAGIRLDTRISVADWMANPNNRHQSLVDRMVAEAKAGLAAITARPAAVDLIADMTRLQWLLDALGNDLTGHTDTLARHSAALQNLDIAAQMIDALKQAVGDDEGRRRTGLHRLQNLRHSSDAVIKSAA